MISLGLTSDNMRNKVSDQTIRECVQFYDGKFPKDCFIDGYVMHFGAHIYYKDFEKWAKEWRKTK